MATRTKNKRNISATIEIFNSIFRIVKKKGTMKDRVDALKYTAPIFQAYLLARGEKENSPLAKNLFKEVSEITKKVKK